MELEKWSYCNAGSDASLLTNNIGRDDVCKWEIIEEKSQPENLLAILIVDRNTSHTAVVEFEFYLN